jgi:hypothetical protein
MIDVAVKYENVMIEVYDGESPWRCGDCLDPNIVKWLNSHCGDDWDWAFTATRVVFRFHDHSIATLFKLTWG